MAWRGVSARTSWPEDATAIFSFVRNFLKSIGCIGDTTVPFFSPVSMITSHSAEGFSAPAVTHAMVDPTADSILGEEHVRSKMLTLSLFFSIGDPDVFMMITASGAGVVPRNNGDAPVVVHGDVIPSKVRVHGLNRPRPTIVLFGTVPVDMSPELLVVNENCFRSYIPRKRQWKKCHNK